MGSVWYPYGKVGQGPKCKKCEEQGQSPNEQAQILEQETGESEGEGERANAMHTLLSRRV